MTINARGEYDHKATSAQEQYILKNTLQEDNEIIKRHVEGIDSQEIRK